MRCTYVPFQTHTHTHTVARIPAIGEDGVLSENRPLSTDCLPAEVGLRRQVVEYTCIDASQQFLVVGSAQGYVWVIDLLSSRLLREFNVSFLDGVNYCMTTGPYVSVSDQ